MSNRRDFLQLTGAVLTAGGLTDSFAQVSQLKKRTGPLKLAIVGTGQISHRYLKQAAQGIRARFVATCARTLKSAKARAVEYGITQPFGAQRCC